jgi:3-phenylpropionate/cinnamic acid dioxygenase small subunit
VSAPDYNDPTYVADRLAIEDLLTRYALAIDTKDWDLLDTVFTPDAKLDYTTAGGIAGDYPKVKAWLAEVLAGFPMTQHFITNHAVTIEGDGATVRSYVYNPMGSHRRDGTLKLFYTGGFYVDRMRRTADGWRIVDRYEDMTWSEGLDR